MSALTISPEDVKAVKKLGFLSNKGTDTFSGRIITVNGKINAEQQKVIGEAAELFGNGMVTFTTRLTIEVQGIHYDNIQKFRDYISKANLVTGGTGSKVRPVVACKGTTCQYGLCDTFDLSEKIHNTFFEGYSTVLLPHKFKIAVGGCPNNCVKPDLNDIGIIGQMKPNFDEDSCSGCKVCSVEAACPIKCAKVVDGMLEISDECNNCGRCVGKCHFDAIEDATPGFKVYIGGRWGKKVAHGIPLTKILATEEEAMSVVEKTILLFREKGITGERFSDTIERLGFEDVNAEILSDDILARKQAILDAKLHEVGGATC